VGKTTEEFEKMKDLRKTMGTVLVAFLVLVLMAAGCSDESSNGSVTDREVDVLVVGSGIAGSVAAAKAADAGVQVLLIEKLAIYGGTSVTAGGGYAGGGVKDGEFTAAAFWDKWEEEATRFDQDDTGYPVEADIKVLAERIWPTVQYINSITSNSIFTNSRSAMCYPFDTTNPLYMMWAIPPLADGTPDWSQYANYGNKTVMTSLRTYLEGKSNVEILMECPAQSIIVEDGVVAGVKALYKGRDFLIRAKEIILATGGYSQNPGMVKQYAGKYQNGLSYVVSTASVGTTGDAITMATALDVGADVYPDGWTEEANAMTRVSGISLGPNLVYVAKTGGLLDLTKIDMPALPTAEFTYAFCYLMVHENNPPYYIIHGSDQSDAATLGSLETAAAGSQKGVEIFSASNTAGLATAIGADAGTLAATINGANLSGTLYAVKVYPTCYDNSGGLVTNQNAQVLDTGGNVIPHLYAAGAVSNRNFFNQMYVHGASLGFYATMGRVAGERAAAAVN
jgi:fumarate reductase flavoprotein subunit